jgi:uncharacterized membrane protein YraQ (UPF0718 family)
MPLSSRKEVGKFVHRKLLFRLRRLAIFFIVVASIIIYELLTYDVAAYIPVIGFVAGIIIGLLINHKMHNISWDAEASKAVTKMDRIGIVILIVYLLFAIFRRWIFSYWLEGYTLTVFSLSVAAGGILGRLYSTRKKIRDILKHEGFLHSKTED